MSVFIFGTDVEAIKAEWAEEDLEPMYGSVENDLMVMAWEQYHNPAGEFKKEDLYEEMKALVHSHKISGVFYRDLEEAEHLAPGDTIDYRRCLTTWIKRQLPEDDPVIMKLACTDATGLNIGRNEQEGSVILGECQLKVISRSEKLIEVQLV